MSDLLLEKLHGHLSVLAVVALAHPWLLSRRARRLTPGARRGAIAAALLILGANALGWILYPPFRETVRLRLYAAGDHLGVLFELKEHLAVAVLALALAAGAMAWRARGEAARTLRPAVAHVTLIAFGLGVLVAALGVYLATTGGFSDTLPG